MTLKQFAKLAGCAIAALILYATPLPGFLKWPLVGFFVLLGLGMAFLPINERPLDVWIVAFFKAVFSPTQYLWQKRSSEDRRRKTEDGGQKTEDRIQSSAVNPQSSVISPQPSVISPQSSVISKPPDFDAQEEEFLKNLQKTFAGGPINPMKIKIEPPGEQIRQEAVAAKVAREDFIFAPTQPNIIYGVIKNNEGKFVDAVIMEIRDSQENVVRALRSNKLGQFRIATPLSNGIYEIDPEKEGLDFDIIKIDLKGEVMPPIEIISK